MNVDQGEREFQLQTRFAKFQNYLRVVTNSV